jgi:serine protease AprX
MKKSGLLLFIFLLAFPALIASKASAQKPVARFLVSFTDKSGTPFQVTNPAAFLSVRAIDRRVKFNIPVTVQDLPVAPHYLDSLSSHGVQVISASKWLNAALIETDDSSKAMSVLNLPFVQQVELLYYKSFAKNKPSGSGIKSLNGVFDQQHTSLIMAPAAAATPPPDQRSGINYGFAFAQANMLGATYLHQLGYTGDSIQIAVLDAGFIMVDQMQAFDTLRANNKILSTRNVVSPGESVYSAHSHGTYVLSIMGGNLPGSIVGTAPGAGYHLVLTEDVASEFPVEEFYWVVGAEYADSIGADMINSSLGYTTFDLAVLNHTFASMDGKTTLSARGAAFASARGMLVVASAGNGGGSGWFIISSPGDADSILTVGAVDVNGVYAPFSSTGKSADGRVKPDVAAVGWNATFAGTGGGYFTGNGTSFSSPVLCGAVACLWQANPNMSNHQIMDAVRRSSHQYLNPDTLLGYGIPNLAIAHLILGGQEIPDLNKDRRFVVAPNPFHAMMLISFQANDTQVVKLQLYNMQGRLLQSAEHRKIPGMNVISFNDLNQLSPGAYVLRILDGQQIFTEKVIKR